MEKGMVQVFTQELEQLILEAKRLEPPRTVTSQEEPSRWAPPAEQDEIFDLVLSHPSMTVDTVIREFERKHKRRPMWGVRKVLYQYYIGQEDGREACQVLAIQFHSWLRIFLNSSDLEECRKAYSAFRSGVRGKLSNSQVSSRIALKMTQRDFLALPDTPDNRAAAKAIQDLLLVLRPENSRRAFNQLIDQLSEERGIRKKQNSKQRAEEIIETVEALTTEIDAEGAGDSGLGKEPQEKEGVQAKKLTMEQLEEQNNAMRGTLVGLSVELKNLKERIRDLESNAQAEGAINILGEMNSPAHGMLLDNLYTSGVLLGKLMEDGWMPPDEIQSVPYLMIMFAQFLDQVGVEKIKEKGAQECLTLDNLGEFNYVGSEFKDQEDKKMVEFRTPGWRYKGTTFSRPQAVEIKGSQEGNK